MQDIWLSRFSHSALRFVWSGKEQIRNTFSLKETNRLLSEENFRLKEQIRQLTPDRENQPENAAPRTNMEFSYVNARVVQVSSNSQRNYIIINKGSTDGVRPYSGIISASGIVGVINSVGKHYSYGLTLMNTKMSASVRIGRGGPVTSLVWDGRSYDGAIIKGRYVNSPDFIGDTVWTSGLSKLFPGDCPVGIVRGSHMTGGSYKTLEVGLLQSFDALQYVTVTLNPDSSEIDELIEKESGKK